MQRGWPRKSQLVADLTALSCCKGSDDNRCYLSVTWQSNVRVRLVSYELTTVIVSQLFWSSPVVIMSGFLKTSYFIFLRINKLCFLFLQSARRGLLPEPLWCGHLDQRPWGLLGRPPDTWTTQSVPLAKDLPSQLRWANQDFMHTQTSCRLKLTWNSYEMEEIKK